MWGGLMSITIYTAQRMSGRMCDEMLREAEMLKRVLNNYGFKVLNPVIEEGIEDIHEPLENVHPGDLFKFWKRDKEMIRESDILIDYLTMNKSDGSNKEVAYSRFCLWKPTIRVWEGAGALISRIEDDIVVSYLTEAVDIINEKWNTKEKLGLWRKEMLERSFPKWIKYQHDLIDRYEIDPMILEKLAYKSVLGGL
jgi:hypothetical protein